MPGWAPYGTRSAASDLDDRVDASTLHDAYTVQVALVGTLTANPVAARHAAVALCRDAWLPPATPAALNPCCAAMAAVLGILLERLPGVAV